MLSLGDLFGTRTCTIWCFITSLQVQNSILGAELNTPAAVLRREVTDLTTTIQNKWIIHVLRYFHREIDGAETLAQTHRAEYKFLKTLYLFVLGYFGMKKANVKSED